MQYFIIHILFSLTSNKFHNFPSERNMRQKNSMKLVFLFVFYHFISLVSAHQLAPALYVFGDSLVDSGNNDLLPTMLRADYWPYGMNFPQGTTGRFTNGKTCADFLGMIQFLHVLMFDVHMLLLYIFIS